MNTLALRCGLAAAALLTAMTAAAQEMRPNVLFILADDLGVGDLTSYSGDQRVPTPNLDALAANGLRFTQAYCPASVCSPSRYALMTGAYAWRSWKTSGVLANWEAPLITDGQPTLPGLLHDAGYNTAGFGKWHLGAIYPTLDGQPPAGRGLFKSDDAGRNIDLSKPVASGPVAHGFETWKGLISLSESFILDGDRIVAALRHPSYPAFDTPGYADLPVVTMTGLHARVTDDTLAFLADHDPKRPFFLYYAPYVPHIPLAVEPRFKGTTEGGDYGDYVHQLDEAVGRLLASLDEHGLRDNTIIVFASDNGSQWEETGTGHRPNGRYRGGKWTAYEGGVRMPLIIAWPGHVRPGTASEALCSMTDFLATLCAMTGITIPANAGPDSIDQSSLILAAAPASATPLRSEVMIQSSRNRHGLRVGDWKLIIAQNGDPKVPYELYDLAEDPAETTNVAETYPERANSLKAHMDTLLASPSTRP